MSKEEMELLFELIREQITLIRNKTSVKDDNKESDNISLDINLLLDYIERLESLIYIEEEV